MDEKEHYDQLSKNDNRIRLYKYLVVGGITVLVIAAFLVGRSLSGNKKTDVTITTVQQSSEEPKKEVSIKTFSQPKEVVNAFFTAIKQKNYTEAVKYISASAKAKDARYGDASYLQEQFFDNPLTDYLVKDITYTDDKDIMGVAVSLKIGSQNNTEKFTIELENGQMMINPLGKY